MAIYLNLDEDRYYFYDVCGGRMLDILYRRCKAESKAEFPEMSARIGSGE